MFKQAWTRLQAITLLASCGSAGLQDVNGGEAVAAPRQAPKPTKPNKRSNRFTRKLFSKRRRSGVATRLALTAGKNPFKLSELFKKPTSKLGHIKSKCTSFFSIRKGAAKARSSPGPVSAATTATVAASPPGQKTRAGKLKRFFKACIPRRQPILDTPLSSVAPTPQEVTPALPSATATPATTAAGPSSRARRALTFEQTSPLAAGMQQPSTAADDFVIAAFPGTKTPGPCSPPIASSAPPPPPMSPPVKTASQALTMIDVQHKLPNIFHQLPAAKVSPTKTPRTMMSANGDTENVSPCKGAVLISSTKTSTSRASPKRLTKRKSAVFWLTLPPSPPLRLPVPREGPLMAFSTSGDLEVTF